MLSSRYPFDWRAPAGYLAAYLSQCALGPAVGSLFIQLPIFVFGSGWFFICIVEDIKQDVAEFNIMVKTTSDVNRIELTKCFCDIVQIFTDAKQ